MNPQCLLFVSVVVFAVPSTPGRGQAPQQESRLRPRFGHAVRSPEVQADGRVTFRFRAPNAKEVSLVREGVPRVVMSKDDRGVWSATTDPLPPDFYVYRFHVDGVALGDPGNPLVKPFVMGGHESLVHVPGPATLSWELNDVPHGTLHRHLYKSKVIGETREFWVYTPPSYNPADEQKYPVLYLLHGVGDDASAWTSAGRANVILDNLIARGQAKPMLIVMPLGYGFPNAPDRVGEMFGPSNQQKIMDAVAGSLLDEVIPMVERTYRVAKDRESRAIAGLSMGGSQALYIGLNHRDRFAWIGSFSGAFIMYGGNFEKLFPDLGAGANPQIRLLWTACGAEDFLIGVNRRYKDWLKSKEVRFTPVETPGAHTWTVWRRNLTEFSPLLFQSKTD